ncbi:MAG: hypothetical protein HC875_34390 [Anaerolineales bacterium]|nr:hypothetical protein [Anaerolineales bacterium]
MEEWKAGKVSSLPTHHSSIYPRSCVISPATTLPDSMTIGTPPPGWVVPPTK